MRGLLTAAVGLLMLVGAGVPPAQAGATDRSYVGGRFVLELVGNKSFLDSFEKRHGVLAEDVDLGSFHVTVYILDNSAEPEITLTPVHGVHFDDAGNPIGDVVGLHVVVQGWDPKQKKGRLGLDIQGDLEGNYEEAAQVDLKAGLDITDPFKVEDAFFMDARPLIKKQTKEPIGIHVEMQPTGSESSQLVLLGDLSGDKEEDDDEQGDDKQN